MSSARGRRSGTVRFDHFVVDFETGDVWKHGVAVRLRGQPLDLLAILVERPGELITREQIREDLWPEQAAGSFDHNINILVNRLRAVLGENPAGQAYIETLRSQGYRFHGSPQWQEREVPLPEEAAPVADPVSIPVPARPNFGRALPWIGVAAVALILAGVALPTRFRSVFSARTNLQIVPLLDYPGQQDQASFSPDGRFVAFLWKQEGAPVFDVFVKAVGSTAPPLRLTSGPDPKVCPVWSPNGQEIAYVRRTPNRNQIYVVPVLGGAERLLAPIEVTEPDISWAPTGGLLAFVATPQGEKANRVHVLDLATGQTRRISGSQPGLGDRQPVFSPDGKSIAFVRTGAIPASGSLWFASAAGGSERRLTSDVGTIRGIAWSTEAREIVFSSNWKGLFRLWRLALDGTAAVEPLLVAGYNAQNPVISRNASALAWTENSTNINIWQYQTGAGKPPRKLIASSRNQHSPRYSPDGTRVAFAADRSGSEEIWVSDRDGQSPVRLTEFGGPPTGSPRWSPDGRWIAFDSRPEANADIYVVPAQGGKPRRLTDDPARDFVPNWSRDGSTLYFCSDRSGQFEIWRMPASGGSATRVTLNGGFDSVESPDGRYLYYTKGRRPGVFRLSLTPGGAGVEEEVPALRDAGKWRYWDITAQGYFFVAPGSAKYPSLHLYDLSTKLTSELQALTSRADLNAPGLTVSPDAKTVLFTQIDHATHDVMMVQPYR